MLPDTFEHLPDDADVWIHAADSPLDADTVGSLDQALDELTASWSSHGRRVLGAHAVIDARLAVVAAYVPDGTISGCGIDKSLHALGRVAAECGFDWVDGLSIVFRSSDGQLTTCTRPEFRSLAADGDVDSGTPVVDLALRRLGDLRSGGLERPAGQSWHAQVFSMKSAGEKSATGALHSS